MWWVTELLRAYYNVNSPVVFLLRLFDERVLPFRSKLSHRFQYKFTQVHAWMWYGEPRVAVYKSINGNNVDVDNAVYVVTQVVAVGVGVYLILYGKQAVKYVNGGDPGVYVYSHAYVDEGVVGAESPWL